MSQHKQQNNKMHPTHVNDISTHYFPSLRCETVKLIVEFIDCFLRFKAFACHNIMFAFFVTLNRKALSSGRLG